LSFFAVLLNGLPFMNNPLREAIGVMFVIWFSLSDNDDSFGKFVMGEISMIWLFAIREVALDRQTIGAQDLSRTSSRVRSTPVITSVHEP
jgi:hypothetical protein